MITTIAMLSPTPESTAAQLAAIAGTEVVHSTVPGDPGVSVHLGSIEVRVQYCLDDVVPAPVYLVVTAQDLEAARERCEAAGARVTVWHEVRDSGFTVYVDGGMAVEVTR